LTDSLLVLNAGSSSLKFSLYELAAHGPEPRLRGRIEELHRAARFSARDASGTALGERAWPPGALGASQALSFLIDWLAGHGGAHPAAVGHRVVHGGTAFAEPVRVDAATLERLEQLAPLAPLHQRANLEPIRALAERDPGLTQIACFDTAFHRTQPEPAQALALPEALTREGVRRYGFHGLSYEYVAGALARHDARAAAGRSVIAHLGNGASMCALRGARSIATTMGFSTLDGLPMGTRPGALDPGVLLWLMDAKGMGAREIEDLLYHRSGLLGVSGTTSDMRALLASDAPAARRAVDLFVYRIGRELGSLAAALGGLDALVFTAGIGEHAAEIRARVCRDAAWLGVELDESANGSGGPRISSVASRVSAWVIATDEELMIARHAARLVHSS
jgi:acetate kinase